MRLVMPSLGDYAVEASDGAVGTVADFLFDDVTWTMQWLVVETGSWPSKRKVLLQPSTVANVNVDWRTLVVGRTRAQIEACPPVHGDAGAPSQDESGQVGSDRSYPHRGNSYSGSNWPAATSTTSPVLGSYVCDVNGRPSPAARIDPHLHSLASVVGDRIHAVDGPIGHVQNVIVETTDWAIRYLIVDTGTWWPGRHVLVSPYAVVAVHASDREIRLDVPRKRVRDSPAWEPVAPVDRAHETQLHSHYGWPTDGHERGR